MMKIQICLISILISISAWLAVNSPIFIFNKTFNASFISLPEIIPFKGKLEPNSLLQNAKYIGHTKLRGPETLVFARNGSLYTGLLNGKIVRIDVDTDEVFMISQVGDEPNESICEDYGPNIHAHRSCGRPLGLRFKPDNEEFLYFVDAYYGIFKLDLKQGTKKLLLSSSDARFKNKPPKMLNDLDIDGHLIYFIDSSDVREINEAIEEAVEAQSRGRLFVYNELTDQLELLTVDLYFPNGLQLMPNKNEILINECSSSRILKYHVGGASKGLKEVFAELPGLGDTIRLTDYGTLLVPIGLTRRSKYSSLADLLSSYPMVRNLLGTFINLRGLLLNYKIIPKYGLLLEYDLNGQIIRSWHDPTGRRIAGTASAAIYKNKIYIGSYYSDFIGVVDY